MYTIKEASARSGVPVASLRAWERRYGVVTPARTTGGYRLYDEAAIARLRAMRTLVEDGRSPSQAAAAVLAGDAGAPSPLSAPVIDADGPTFAPSAATSSEALVAAAGRYDTAGIESVLDGILASGSYEAVVDDHLLPAVAALGSAWARGRLDIAAEHLASEAVQRRLAAMFDLSSAPGVGPAVVVGLPPGDLHEIGAIAFSVALRRRGIDVLYLGPNVPVASWVHALQTTGAAAAVIAVARPADIRAAREVVAALLEARPGVIVAIGGPVADRAAEGGARPLAARVVDAALELSHAVAR